MRIYTVSFNDGGWHSGILPEFNVVANSEENAIEIARVQFVMPSTSDAWAVEFKLDGYVIEIYDEISYIRNKKINNLLK